MAAELGDRESEADRRSFQLYIDESGRIAMARGNTDAWLGLPMDALKGRSVAEFAAEESQFAISEILVQAALREFLPPAFYFMCDVATGAVNGFEVTGKPQGFNDQYRLSFVQDPQLVYAPKSKNTRTGFVDSVEKAISDAMAEDRDIDMTFLDIGDVGKLADLQGMDEEELRRFTDKVENRLKAESVGGDGLGRVEQGKYGLVHDRDRDIAALKDEIQTYARDIDPDGAALTVGASTVMLDAQAMESGEIKTALSHAVDAFADTGIDSVIFETLADSQAAFVDLRHSRLALLEKSLQEDLLSSAFTPVADIARWSVHHLLAEFNVSLEDDGMGAGEILKLCEGDAEMRTRVDAAQCRKILTREDLDEFSVAVDVAIRSLLDPEVVGMLLEFKHRAPHRDLTLRLSGLDQIPWDKVQTLEILRRAGFNIALSGRDVGAVTPDKLTSLPADYILLDPNFVLDATQLKRSLPMLESMVKRCAEHEIAIVFEGVVDAEAARLLSKIDGALCTGPYFGPSIEDLEDLRLPRRSNG